MITTDQVTTLVEPFAVDDHEFKNGLPYITEQAITTRLDIVDPCWSFRVTDVQWRDETVIVYAELSVCGVTRQSNGNDTVEYKRDAERIPANVTNSPEKAALTDALKRCARLFGIGRYLLEAPKSVNSYGALRAWLQQRNSAPRNPFADPATQHAIVTAQKNYGLHTDAGRAFILSNIVAGRAFVKFSDLHPLLGPDDVLKAIPVLAERFQPSTPAPDLPREFLARRSGSSPRPDDQREHRRSGEGVGGEGANASEADTDPGLPPLSERRTTANGSISTPSSTTQPHAGTDGSDTPRTMASPSAQSSGASSLPRLGRPGSPRIGQPSADAFARYRPASSSASSGATPTASASSTSTESK